MDASIGAVGGVAVLPRAIAFVDGQNLYHSAREAFGYHHPNYDVKVLAEEICRDQGWRLTECRFYTGMPSPRHDFFWYTFWVKKLAQMGRQRIRSVVRELRYQRTEVQLPDGTASVEHVGHEKGIDVRLALDVVRLAREDFLDVALIFSQDQDLAEAVDEVRDASHSTGRKVEMACAFPFSAGSKNKRGINRTRWIRITKELYDKCLDHRDYRP